MKLKIDSLRAIDGELQDLWDIRYQLYERITSLQDRLRRLIKVLEKENLVSKGIKVSKEDKEALNGKNG